MQVQCPAQDRACVCAKSLQLCLTLCDPKDCNAPVHGILQARESWSGLPRPPPEDCPNPGIEPGSLKRLLAGRFFTTSATWEAPGSSLLLGKQVWIPTFPKPSPPPKRQRNREQERRTFTVYSILSCFCYTLRSENTTPAKPHLQTSPLS